MSSNNSDEIVDRINWTSNDNRIKNKIQVIGDLLIDL